MELQIKLLLLILLIGKFIYLIFYTFIKKNFRLSKNLIPTGLFSYTGENKNKIDAIFYNQNQNYNITKKLNYGEEPKVRRK